MKKLMILSTVAVAALSLAACKNDTPAPGNDVGNDISLNTDAPVEGNIVDETTFNASDNATVADNATAIDTASNATAK